MLGLFVMMAFVSTTRECTGLVGVAGVEMAGAGLGTSTASGVAGTAVSLMVRAGVQLGRWRSVMTRAFLGDLVIEAAGLMVDWGWVP